MKPEHPSKELCRILDQKGLSLRETARVTGLSSQHVFLLRKGDRSFSPDVACKLGRAGIGDPFKWLKGQAIYSVYQWEKENK